MFGGIFFYLFRLDRLRVVSLVSGVAFIISLTPGLLWEKSLMSARDSGFLMGARSSLLLGWAVVLGGMGVGGGGVGGGVLSTIISSGDVIGSSWAVGMTFGIGADGE